MNLMPREKCLGAQDKQQGLTIMDIGGKNNLKSN